VNEFEALLVVLLVVLGFWVTFQVGHASGWW